MTNFRYFKLSKSKKIRYLCNNYKKNLYIVFLHGFMSDLEGEKPKVFQKSLWFFTFKVRHKTMKKNYIGFIFLIIL